MELTSPVSALLLGLLLGCALGAALGWSLSRSRAATSTQGRHAGSADVVMQQQAIAQVVQPVQASLAEVERHLDDLERARHEAYGELRAQVQAMSNTSDALRGQTQTLVNALRAPHVRGRWGEVQLRRVVELAGMVEHCDFDEQPTFGGRDGTVRPDLVVRLAGGKNVVVDAKVPFAGYLEALEATEPHLRDERMRAHARHLRAHIDGLADKKYWELLQPTPEFVVLFVPAEPFLSAALEEDPALLEHAFSRNVVVATPNTLVALLRTVAHTWRQEALADNAHQVHALGKELYARLATMGSHLTKLGNGLDAAVRSYNQAIGSLENRVLVSARKMSDLQVVDAELLAPPPIDLAARLPQATELRPDGGRLGA